MKIYKISATLLGFAICLTACNNLTKEQIKQNKDLTVAELQYKLSSSKDLKDKINYAYQILDVDYDNKTATNFIFSAFYNSKNSEAMQQVANKSADLSYQNLDDFAFLVKTVNLMSKAQISSVKIDNLLNAYFKYSIENEKINPEFVKNNFVLYNRLFQREIAFGNFDLFLEINELFDANLDELPENQKEYFKLMCFKYYDFIYRITPPKPLFSLAQDKKELMNIKREIYLDYIIKNRKKYLVSNADFFILTLANANENMLALDVADDFKNINAFTNDVKTKIRANAYAYNRNYRRALEIALPIFKGKHEMILCSWANNCGNYQLAEEIVAKTYQKDKSLNTILLYINALIKNEKFDQAKQIVDSHKNEIKLLPIIYSTTKEIETDNYFEKTKFEIEKILQNKDALKSYKDDELYMFISSAAEYLGMTNGGNLIMEMYELFKDKFDLNNNIGYSLLEANYNLPIAYDLIKKAYDENPSNLNIIDSYAWSLYMQKRYAEAKEAIDRLLNMGVNETILNLGVVYLHAGDIYRANNLETEAIKFYEKAANQLEKGTFKYDDLKKRF